jgi:hypothetical protein
MSKPKQRAAYFTDKEWDEVKEAVEISDKRNIAHFINEAVMKSVKRIKANELRKNANNDNS